MAEFLRSADLFVWSIEGDPRLRSTIVTLILLDRCPDWTEVVNRFDSLSRTVPSFRQRVVMSSLPSAPPRWEFDPDFDLSFHLRRVTISAPGTLDNLLEMARLSTMADFDRARPLWEVTLVDGMSDGGAALLCKLHHALTDGVGAVEIASGLFDPAEGSQTPSASAAPVPHRSSPLSQVWDELSYEFRLAAGAVTGALTALPTMIADGIGHPRRTVTDAYSTLASMYRAAGPISGPGSSIMLDRSMIRRVAVHQVPKSALRRAGAVTGGTLNDAFIAAVVGGVCRYHQKRGVAFSDLIVTMPISIRNSGDPVGGNRAT